MDKTKKHWVITVVAALMMSAAIGLNINTLGVFLEPVATGLNVQMGEISMHSTLISLGIAFAALFVNPLIEKYGHKSIITVSSIVAALATVGFAYATEIWMFNILGFVRGVSSAFFGIVTIQTLINNWFVQLHGRVTSLVFSFSGIVGALLSPLFAGIIAQYGYQNAYLILAAFFILFTLPAILIPYEFKPEDEGLAPYGSHSVAQDFGSIQNTETANRKPFSLGSLTFILTMVFAFTISGLTGLVQHLSGIGGNLGFTPVVAAYMISAAMIGNITFKVVIGAVSDWKGTKVATVLLLAVVLAGLFFISTGSNPWLVLLGSFFFGAIYGLSSAGLSLLVTYLFNAADFSKVFSKVNFISNMGAAIAVSLYGISFDVSGSYTLGLTASFIIVVLGIVLVFTANSTSKA